nr:hypothetical protein [Tanacetum cinerariifolium]
QVNNSLSEGELTTSFKRRVNNTSSRGELTTPFQERAFATIINKCLSGKETEMDKIHLSRAQILLDMFHKKNIDYVYLLWEDLLFQIENKDVKKINKMSYPKFTKIIIDYFMSKDQSISRRNKMFCHTARDDTMFTSIRLKLKTKAKVTKSNKKKQPAKMTKAKGLAVLSEVALTEAEQLKLATKRSRKDFYISHASGLDGGTGTIPGVLDVPIYDSESNKESWGDSDEEDDDENNINEEANINDDDSDDTDESDDERTESGSDVIHDPNKTNEEHDEEEEEYDDEFNLEEDENVDEEEYDKVTKELYDDVNVNLGNEDIEMTNAHQLVFEQEEEDDYVTLTPVLDAQKTEGPTQSSSVSSDFTSKLLNIDNPSPADNEIASVMDNTSYHATSIPEITSSFATSTPPPPLFFNPLQQKVTPTPTPTTSEQVDQYAQALSSIPAIVDRYIDNKLGEAINKAIQAHNFDCKEEAQDEKRECIELVDSTVRTIIKEEVNAQLPQILPQAI